MVESLQQRLAAPDGYDLLSRTLEELRRCGAPPTLASLELWAHALIDPGGETAQSLARYGANGGDFTEDAVVALSRRLLAPRRRESDLRATAENLARQLDEAASALAEAQRSTATYARVLEIAGAALGQGPTKRAELGPIALTLASATQRVMADGSAVEKRLEASARDLKLLQERFAPPPKDLVDALTTLPNRKAFDTALQEALAAPSLMSDATTLVLALVDVEVIKRVRDRWGPQTADDVLRYVAGALAQIAETPGLTARYGSETFALLIPGVTVGSAVIQLERVRREIAERRLTRRSDGEEITSVTIALGASPIRPGDTRTMLLERVDRALYTSKKAGGDRLTMMERMESAMR